MHNWKDISLKLDDQICSSTALVEVLLSRADKEDEVEKTCWWNFLSKLSGVYVDELIRRAKEIKKNQACRIEKEEQYCKLLGIPLPWRYELLDGELRRQIEELLQRHIDVIFPRQAWLFRWIYTYTDENNKTPRDNGIKRHTLIRRLKEGKKFSKVFKRASFTTSVKNGTPEKWSSDLINVDF